MSSNKKTNRNREHAENKENMPFHKIKEWNKGLFISSKSIPTSHEYDDKTIQDITHKFEFLRSFNNIEYHKDYRFTAQNKNQIEELYTNAENNVCESLEDKLWVSQKLDLAGTDHVEKLARMHKLSASNSKPHISWTGKLEYGKTDFNFAKFSPKFFVGGLPAKMTKEALESVFSIFGSITICWPKRNKKSPEMPTGYVYGVFGKESSVLHLLSKCKQSLMNDDFFYTFSYVVNDYELSAEVQIIPWLQSDLFYHEESAINDSLFRKTVFVGALHGTINASSLFQIMSEIFGAVKCVEIDCDRYKYPIGSAKVTFGKKASYLKAIETGFLEVKCEKFTKKIQIDPYFEDSICQRCNIDRGTYFCRNLTCLMYYCTECWRLVHLNMKSVHLPVTRDFY